MLADGGQTRSVEVDLILRNCSRKWRGIVAAAAAPVKWWRFQNLQIPTQINVVIEEIKYEQVTAAVTTAVDFTQSGGSILASQTFL